MRGRPRQMQLDWTIVDYYSKMKEIQHQEERQLNLPKGRALEQGKEDYSTATEMTQQHDSLVRFKMYILMPLIHYRSLINKN